jgi:molecular chaperone DnaK
VRRLVAEPTAAALGYGAHREPTARFAVVDLGGGTFDVSIVNVEDGVFEVISTHGDNLLGGDDFDRRMVERLAEEISDQHGLDVAADPTALGRLREEAERAKVNLSEAAQATLQIPYLGKAKGQVVNYIRILKRQELESWTADVVQRLEPPCREALLVCGLKPEEVDQVILVGGMTRMPAVQRKIEQIFARRATKNANPDEAVAIGAATECAILAGKISEVVLLDVTSRTLGLHLGGGKFAPVIPRNATLPARETRLISTNRDSQRELPVEVYAGESIDVRRNRHLGTFVLGGLPDAPAGEVMVLVDFTVDIDGCLTISAREVTSGAHADIRLTATCGLTRTEVHDLAEGRRGSRMA